jgi:hypothetical protein
MHVAGFDFSSPICKPAAHACGIERMDGMRIDGDALAFVYGMQNRSWKELQGREIKMHDRDYYH